MLLQTRLLCLLFSGFLLASTSLFAQEEFTPEQLDRKTERTLRDANKAFQNRNFLEAAALYEEVFSAYPNYFKVAYQLGRCNFYMRNLDTEIEWYNQAIAVDPDGNDTIYFDLGTALMKNGQYDEAKAQFERFLQRYSLEDDFAKQAKIRIQGCEFSLSQQNVDPAYRVTLVEGLNEAGTDFDPTPYFIKGDSFMIVTSHREGNRGKKKVYERLNEPFSDLWIAHMVNDTVFEEIENMGKKVNTKANDGSAIIAPDGLTMYYTICNRGRQRKKYGCSIFMSEFNPNAKTWGKYQLVEGINGEREVVVNSRGKTKKVPTYDADPTLTADGQTMYFVSDRDGGLGNTDIWYSTRVGNAWSTPVHCGDVVNTAFNEAAPTIGQDGTTLYYSTDGLPGFGGYDIFRAKGKQSAFEEPENLGLNLNSSFNDLGVVWLYQDSIGYIASNRPGGVGKFDIYRVQYIYRPPLEITIRGTIRDKDTREPVSFALAILYEITENEEVIPLDTFQTDQTGGYEFELEEEKRYKIVGNAPEYLANEEYVSTVDADDNVTPEQLAEDGSKYIVDIDQDIDILLKAIKIDQPIVLQNVYFDFDSSNVRSDAVPALERLMKIMRDNPNITIQMGAHTDTNGTENYNKALSNRRAKSVMNYLQENGINADRLSWFGFGETEPLIYPELSDTDEQANRRVEFRIKSINYEPSEEE